jgi:hypothetical protein
MMEITVKNAELLDGSMGNIRTEMTTLKVNVRQQIIGHFLSGFEVIS